MKLGTKKLTRRSFLRKLTFFVLGVLGLGLSMKWRNLFPWAENKAHAASLPADIPEAYYYHLVSGDRIQCDLCFRRCLIENGKRGYCTNRLNKEGKLYNLVYNRPAAIQIDPIEKEPQLHMLPGTQILCMGTAGCNFKCRFCHNWHLAMSTVEETRNYYMKPEEFVDLAIKRNTPTISFTYNEPIAFYDYIYDIAKIAKKKDVRVLWHTNGSMNPEPLKDLLQYTDAVTLDLKAFTAEFYRNTSFSNMEPVLQSLKIIYENGTHLEVVNLIIPLLNDDIGKVHEMARWINHELSPDIPLHFSRFYPAYKLMNTPPTPVSTLEEAHKAAKEEGMNYVTIGNVPGHKLNSTFCPRCGEMLIYRKHFAVLENKIRNGKCPKCGLAIPGIWS